VSTPPPLPPWHRPVRLPLSDLLRLGLVGIRTRRMRAALSALGISIGIATMILVMGIPASSQRALEAELTALGTDRLQAVANSKLAPPARRRPFRRRLPRWWPASAPSEP
jgi:putative ABC transport system permease protein